MRRAITVLFVLMLLSGFSACSSVPKVEALADADGWMIPVVPAEVVPTRTDGEATRIDKNRGGQDLVVISVPPSATTTKIEVRPVKRSVKDRLLSNKPALEVKSDHQGVTAAQPKKALWWRWVLAVVLGLFVLAAAVMVIVNKVSNWSPWGAVKKLLGR